MLTSQNDPGRSQYLCSSATTSPVTDTMCVAASAAPATSVSLAVNERWVSRIVKLAVMPGLSRGASSGSTWKCSSIGSLRKSVAMT